MNHYEIVNKMKLELKELEDISLPSVEDWVKNATQRYEIDKKWMGDFADKGELQDAIKERTEVLLLIKTFKRILGSN